MRIVCYKESLIKVLSIAENIIASKSNISILSNILMEAKDNILKITASETKLNFFAEVNVDILEEGSISVHCNKFYSIIKKMPGEEILVQTDDKNTISIQTKSKNNLNYVLKGIESEKFPVIKIDEDINFFSIKQETLSDMIKKTIFNIPQNENRRYVNGIFFEIDENGIKMVSTDGKRLSFIKKTENINIKNFEKGIIIPYKILWETLKLCSGNGDVLISLNNKNIYFKIDNFLFLSNLLEGTFPPYEKVIPMFQPVSLKINRAELYESLDRISQICDKESHKITFILSNGLLKIFTEDITIGFGEESIPLDYKGEELKIFLNYVFILDVLNVLKKENIIFEFKDAQSTVTVKEEENDEFVYIMMPMSS